MTSGRIRIEIELVDNLCKAHQSDYGRSIRTCNADNLFTCTLTKLRKVTGIKVEASRRVLPGDDNTNAHKYATMGLEQKGTYETR